MNFLWKNDNELSSYPKNRDIEQGQLRYVLRRNLNKLRILRTVGDFNEWKSYLNLIKMCSKNKI